MKKIALPICLCFYSFLSIYACDPIWYSFCQASNDLVEEKIFIGKIVDQVDNGLELDIIQILKGEESRETIKVWDGIDIDCNGLFSMAVSGYGQTGDTVVCIVQMVDTIANTWEVLGDYRRPSSINYSTYLNVVDGMVVNYDFNPPITYEAFLNDWASNNCLMTTSSKTVVQSNLGIFPNPTSSQLIINDSALFHTYTIRSINGQLIQASTLLNSNTINVAKLKAGIYILKLETLEGRGLVNRFIKQ